MNCGPSFPMHDGCIINTPGSLGGLTGLLHKSGSFPNNDTRPTSQGCKLPILRNYARCYPEAKQILIPFSRTNCCDVNGWLELFT